VQYGWHPTPEQIIYRANILLTKSDEEARRLLETRAVRRDTFPLRAGVGEALLQLDSRNIAGEARAPGVGGMLPTNFFGSPDTVVEQIKRCRNEVGAGVLDLMFQIPGSSDLSFLMDSLELFGKNVLPRIRDI
jgi:alkanesulfonate monooxygenase SsuD/methylene tetrahydromethanopterin reductase-like flavin-dependent oxidoreductase (luciferase family)